MSVASWRLITQKVSNMVTPEVLKTLYSSIAPCIQAMVDTSNGPTNYKKNFSIILDSGLKVSRGDINSGFFVKWMRNLS